MAPKDKQIWRHHLGRIRWPDLSTMKINNSLLEQEGYNLFHIQFDGQVLRYGNTFF